jgi:hypothetical protein
MVTSLIWSHSSQPQASPRAFPGNNSLGRSDAFSKFGIVAPIPFAAIPMSRKNTSSHDSFFDLAAREFKA